MTWRHFSSLLQYTIQLPVNILFITLPPLEAVYAIGITCFFTSIHCKVKCQDMKASPHEQQTIMSNVCSQGINKNFFLSMSKVRNYLYTGSSNKTTVLVSVLNGSSVSRWIHHITVMCHWFPGCTLGIVSPA